MSALIYSFSSNYKASRVHSAGRFPLNEASDNEAYSREIFLIENVASIRTRVVEIRKFDMFEMVIYYIDAQKTWNRWYEERG